MTPAEIASDKVICDGEVCAFETELSARKLTHDSPNAANFKVVFVKQQTLADPMQVLATPHIINLDVDPKEQEPYNYPHLHTWVMAHVGRILNDFKTSEKTEPFIPAGASIDYEPKN